MKWFLRLFVVVSLCVTSWVGFGSHPAMAGHLNLTNFTWNSASMVMGAVNGEADSELAKIYGETIDLNNTNISSYKEYRGLYPTLAKKLIANGPYESVEDILSVPGLSDRQKSTLTKYIEEGLFSVSPTSVVFTQGDDRINNGVYK
ncbi:MAG: photosystem II complex extrinsic protein PsbU [Cyanobacteria bacterium P01_C01_bin.89]